MQKLIIFLLICCNQTIFFGEEFPKLKNLSVFDPRRIKLTNECRHAFFNDLRISDRKAAQCMAIRFTLKQGDPFWIPEGWHAEKFIKWGNIAMSYKAPGK